MKSHGLTTILNGALAVCLVAAVLFCVQFTVLTRDVRKLNAQVNGLNSWRGNVQALAADCVEYSKRNPAIVPILESIGIGVNRAAAPAKPAK